MLDGVCLLERLHSLGFTHDETLEQMCDVYLLLLLECTAIYLLVVYQQMQALRNRGRAPLFCHRRDDHVQRTAPREAREKDKLQIHLGTPQPKANLDCRTPGSVGTLDQGRVRPDAAVFDENSFDLANVAANGVRE